MGTRMRACWYVVLLCVVTAAACPVTPENQDPPDAAVAPLDASTGVDAAPALDAAAAVDAGSTQ